MSTRRVLTLTPAELRALIRRWTIEGHSTAVIAGRLRVLRGAVGWAYDEPLIDSHPLNLMRRPGRAVPRRPLVEDDVRALLSTGATALLEALANDTASHMWPSGVCMELRPICCWYASRPTPAPDAASSPPSL